MTTLLTRIREKVIAAVPSVIEKSATVNETGQVINLVRTIRLADILLAMGDDSAANLGGFTRDLLNSGYDLRSDDLEKQSPECWEFIGEILGV